MELGYGCKKRHIVAGISLFFGDGSTRFNSAGQGNLYSAGRRQILDEYG